MNRKETVAVLFGGRSGEHEVSVITAHQVMDALGVAGYDVLPIYITKDGSWFAGKPLKDLDRYSRDDFNPAAMVDVHRVSLSPDRSIRELVVHPAAKGGFFSKKPRLWADVFFPAIHGTFGEDGTLQGLFELADVPYVGPGVLSSAVAMDKVATKAVCRDAGIPVLSCTTFGRNEWQRDERGAIDNAESQGFYPLIVKPVSLGSSIGVKRCENRDDLKAAVEAALVLDERVLVEKALDDFFEINCSVLGLPARASVCEQPVPRSSLLSFEDKYKRGGGTKGKASGGTKGSGMASLDRIIPAPISEELAARIQYLAIKAFQVTQSSGVARIDFLVDKSTESVYLNELNNPPGSFAFYLWEKTNLSFDGLVTELVKIAQRRHEERRKTLFSFEANLLRKK
jgi:D-alanine-D-alanine ligase